MLHPISLSFSFSTVRPLPRSAWIKTPGNIRGPGTIGLSPRTRVLLQDFKTSRPQKPLNHSKCVHITFGRESTYTYGFNTPDGFAAIPTKDGIKDLGVTFTSNLKFSRHHEITTAKATQLLNLFRRTFPKITETDFHILYSTYIRPILEYGHSITYANSAGDENQLERVQRAATKLVYGL